MSREFAWLAEELLGPTDEARVVRGVANRAASHRLAVHQNTFVVGLVDALAESFPVTHALCGDAFFRAMAQWRVRTAPPASPVITDYARGFPAFIRSFEPAGTVPYLADVAQIEADRIHAHHAADAVPTSPSDFAARLADSALALDTRITLHPAARWHRSAYAAFTIWQAHVEVEDPTSATLEGIDVDAPESVLVTRPHLDVITARLPAGAATLLDHLRDDAPLGAALEAAGPEAMHAGVGADRLLLTLLEHGLAVDLRLPIRDFA